MARTGSFGSKARICPRAVSCSVVSTGFLDLRFGTESVLLTGQKYSFASMVVAARYFPSGEKLMLANCALKPVSCFELSLVERDGEPRLSRLRVCQIFTIVLSSASKEVATVWPSAEISNMPVVRARSKNVRELSGQSCRAQFFTGALLLAREIPNDGIQIASRTPEIAVLIILAHLSPPLRRVLSVVASHSLSCDQNESRLKKFAEPFRPTRGMGGTWL